MNRLDDVLGLCPGSDADQREQVARRFALTAVEGLRDAVVFGTGILGRATALRLTELGLAPRAFSDNDARRWGDTLEGLPVLPPADITDGRSVVIASKYVKDIWAGLSARESLHLVPHYVPPVLFPRAFPPGFHRLCADAVNGARHGIGEAFAALSDDRSVRLFLQLLRFRITLDPLELPDSTPGQYFPGGFWRLTGDEVYVDAGACDGDTLGQFLDVTDGEFEAYHAFEPDAGNLEALRRRVAELADPRVVVHPCGLGERSEAVGFQAGRGGESRIAAGEAQTVAVVALDEDLGAGRVTTVKIDVEGYEREVLSGARGTIEQCRPKLAVSVYHRVEDLWEIPAAIAHTWPFYRQYLRHHTPEIYDTVLYCTPETGP